MIVVEGPYLVRFDWLVDPGVEHDERTYVDGLASARDAFNTCIDRLLEFEGANAGSVRIQAAWYRHVGPDESLEGGAEPWSYVSLLSLMGRR